jgi:hypothetical protein
MNEFAIGFLFDSSYYPNDLSECLWFVLGESQLIQSIIFWLWENDINFSIDISECGQTWQTRTINKLSVKIPNSTDAMFFKLKWG